ncbi:hypothetical protein Avbf_19083 [Armadillidium vulgare]|nr:hypothetical protein Avbf_19083 [Armadillidium vulgare]
MKETELQTPFGTELHQYQIRTYHHAHSIEKRQKSGGERNGAPNSGLSYTSCTNIPPFTFYREKTEESRGEGNGAPNSVGTEKFKHGMSQNNVSFRNVYLTPLYSMV